MERRGISEALSIILILVITTAIFTSIALYATQQLKLDEISARSTLERSKSMISELLSQVGEPVQNLTGIYIILSNYGERDIEVVKVYGDATTEITSNTRIKYMNGTESTSSPFIIPNGEIGIIITPPNHTTIEMITKNGNIFSFAI